MSGFVYFIGDTESAWVKIGYAKNVGLRLKELACASHENLEILAVVPSSASGERALHRALAKEMRRREWFVKSALVKAILQMAIEGAAIDALVAEAAERYADKERRAANERIARLERIIADPETDEGVREVYQRILANVA